MTTKMILPVATSKELAHNKPLKVYFQEYAVVMFRSKENVSAFLDACPHRGLPLSSGCVEGGNIKCRYHNWLFSKDGELIGVPGDPHFKAYKLPLLNKFYAKEHEGLIWLCNDEFDYDELFCPKVNATHEHATIFRRIRANKIEIAENFLDALHTHSIHGGIIRHSKPKHQCAVTIRSVENGYQAEYVEEKQQTGLLSRLFGANIIKSIGRIRHPSIIEIEYLSENNIEMSVVIYIAEEFNNTCKLIIKTYLKKSKVPFVIKALCLAPFQLLVFYQDKRILEEQNRSLALNPQFKPLVRKTDIMRRYIEKVYQGNFEECYIETNIML